MHDVYMMSYLLQFFFFTATDNNNSAEHEGERIMHKSAPALVLPLCAPPPPPTFLLESFHSDRARRDLDGDPKACTHKHMLTCPPVAACHRHILCCQSVAEAADNSCHFTLVAPRNEIHLFLSPTPALPVGLHLNLFCLFRFLYAALSLSSSATCFSRPMNSFSRLLLSTDEPIALRWERVDDFFYKFNWTQKQLKTRAKKTDLRAVLNAWPPLQIHFLETQQLRQHLESWHCGEVLGLIIPLLCSRWEAQLYSEELKDDIHPRWRGKQPQQCSITLCRSISNNWCWNLWSFWKMHFRHCCFSKKKKN